MPESRQIKFPEKCTIYVGSGCSQIPDKHEVCVGSV